MSLRPSMLAAGAVLLLLVVFVVLLPRLGTNQESSESGKKAGTEVFLVSPKPVTSVGHHNGKATQGEAVGVVQDRDPMGPLRLEGQVLDEEGEGVENALVRLETKPPRTTRSEADGSFVFEHLAPRTYAISAQSDDRRGSAVLPFLSEDSAPVVVRVTPGGAILVKVTDERGEPIESATVEVATAIPLRGQTDVDGLVRLDNAPPGMEILYAEAPGFARTYVLVAIRPPGSLSHQSVQLHRGVGVSGTVVDEAGTAIEHARVLAVDPSALLQGGQPDKDGVLTDAKGHFVLPAIRPGTIQLQVFHEEYAAVTSERIVVGDSGHSDTEITMKPGGLVSGIVQDGAGNGSGWAQVRVLAAKDTGIAIDRKVMAEEDGSFSFRGLPRKRLAFVAQSQNLSSEPVLVDLRHRAKVDGLSIPLSMDGTISGAVVSSSGQPVAEVIVTAAPDVLRGAEWELLRVHGAFSATTDGDGQFVLKGLPTTSYQLSVSEAGPFGVPGKPVSATTGERNVRLVLRQGSKVVGKIRDDDGNIVHSASVSLTGQVGVSAVDGRFSIKDVPPGSYELSVRGPDFAATYQPVRVESGTKTVDVGTVIVQTGRRVQGVVTDGAGARVSGANVVLATQLVSSGTNLDPGFGSALDEQMGVRRTVTASDGTFEFRGVANAQQTVVADSPSLGRSHALVVPQGKEDEQFELAIRGVGSIAGTVTVNGSPQPKAKVLVAPTNGSAHILAVNTDERGAFLLKRVTEGEVKVSAMRGSGMSASTTSVTIHVAAGEETAASLDIKEGAVDFLVGVTDMNGATMPAAQVFLFAGKVNVKNGAELNRVFLNSGKEASANKMAFAFEAKEARFESVLAGEYSVCIVPVDGDLQDPAFAQKLQRNIPRLAVHCRGIKIEETLKEQRLDAQVPKMEPFEEE